MKKCIVCGKEFEINDMDVCMTCFSFLSKKYPKYKDFKEVIEWHRDSKEELDE